MVFTYSTTFTPVLSEQIIYTRMTHTYILTYIIHVYSLLYYLLYIGHHYRTTTIQLFLILNLDGKIPAKKAGFPQVLSPSLIFYALCLHHVLTSTFCGRINTCGLVGESKVFLSFFPVSVQLSEYIWCLDKRQLILSNYIIMYVLIAMYIRYIIVYP